MSDTANWFARKLGTQPPPQQQQQFPQQPQQPQQQPYPYPQPTQYPQVPNQAQYPQTPPPGVVQPIGEDDAGHPIVDAGQAMRGWQGTKAAKEDSDTCPECGSSNYFKRQKLRMKSGASPSPICMDCGYNGIFELQFGAAMPVDPNAPVWGEH